MIDADLQKEMIELKRMLDDLMTSDLALSILGVVEHARECQVINKRLMEINDLLSG